MTEHIGQQLGNYRLVRHLGKGGFAEVYLGEHIYLKTQAAIKLLQTKVINQEELDSFLKEARTIAHLVHPHIMRVLDFGVDGETPFLVMDYAPNGTLRQLHPRGTQLSLTTIIPYVKQIAEALQHAHEENFIHRDIKPENMLVGSRNEILLSDFGIALVAQSSRSQSTQDIIGTVAYMSPEQIQGRPRKESDQYSLGIVIYEWLSGGCPFHGSFTELCTQHLFAFPPSLREKVPTLLPDVEQVVAMALAKDPKQRFDSVQAFANALEQANQQPAFGAPSRPATLGVSSGIQDLQANPGQLVTDAMTILHSVTKGQTREWDKQLLMRARDLLGEFDKGISDVEKQRVDDFYDLMGEAVRSETDGKVKAGKIRDVMDVLISSDARSWANTYLVSSPEQVKLLLTVVTEASSLSTLSPAELRSWSDLLIERIGRDFSSLDGFTKSTVVDGLRRYVKTLDDISKTSEAAVLLVDMYDKANALGIPALRGCFLEIRKVSLLRGLRERIIHSPASVSPDDVKQVARLGVEGLTISQLGQAELSSETDATLSLLRQMMKRGRAESHFAEAVVEAYGNLLGAAYEYNNPSLGKSDALLRMYATQDMCEAVWTTVFVHAQTVSLENLSLLGGNISNMMALKRDSVGLAEKYMALLNALALKYPGKEKEICGLAQEIASSRSDSSLIYSANKLCREIS